MKCQSLSDLSSLKSDKEEISLTPKPSSSLFAPLTDDDEFILKPLPFRPLGKTFFLLGNLFGMNRIESIDDGDSGLVISRSAVRPPPVCHWTMKSVRRRCREQQRLKEQYQSFVTTDDEPMSELKQGRYWTRQQRREHLSKAKQYRQRAKFYQEQRSTPFSTTNDFNLLNRIFLRENQREFEEKPHLATKFSHQSALERKKLKRILRENYFHRISSQSNFTTLSHSTVLLWNLFFVLKRNKRPEWQMMFI